MKKIDIIESGLNFLSSQQQPNGSLLSFSSSNQHDFSHAKPYSTVFTTVLILSSLSRCNNPRANIIKKRAVNFLLKQKSKHWTFNYWDRTSKEYTDLPYPDDLDDTFCALAALHTHDKSLITGKALADAVSVLTALEVQEGGPYKTWIVEEDADKIWKDVDLAVNTNIGYFLALNKIDLPNVTQLIEKAISKQSYTSPYYPDVYPLLYFISRWYSGKKKTDAAEFLYRKRGKKHWVNPLNAACAITALLNFGYDWPEQEDDIVYLEKSLYKPEPHAFYTGINPERDRTYFAGSPALTAALSLEAIMLYTERKQLTKPHRQGNTTMHVLHKAVLKKIEKRMAQAGPEISRHANALISKLRKTDNDVHIILLPYLFYSSLKTQTKLPKKLFVDLGAANLYGWIAYTIYDDFLDEEGMPSALPTANVCLRELTSIFEEVLPKQLFHATIDRIDSANAWETTHCPFDGVVSKIPDFGDLQQLADKSLGHALGPVAVLHALGFSNKSIEVKRTWAFFRHYLIARQLNDDAHDWEIDLKKNRINAVAAMLLERSDKKLKFEKLEKKFWTKTVVEIAHIMLEHVLKAEKAILSNPMIENTGLYKKLLQPITQSAEKVLSEQRKAREFISSYSK